MTTKTEKEVLIAVKVPDGEEILYYATAKYRERYYALGQLPNDNVIQHRITFRLVPPARAVPRKLKHPNHAECDSAEYLSDCSYVSGWNECVHAFSSTPAETARAVGDVVPAGLTQFLMETLQAFDTDDERFGDDAWGEKCRGFVQALSAQREQPQGVVVPRELALRIETLLTCSAFEMPDTNSLASTLADQLRALLAAAPAEASKQIEVEVTGSCVVAVDGVITVELPDGKYRFMAREMPKPLKDGYSLLVRHGQYAPSAQQGGEGL